MNAYNPAAYLERLHAERENVAARKAERDAIQQWLADELAKQSAWLAQDRNDPLTNLRFLELVEAFTNVDTEDMRDEWRSEVRPYGVDSEGYPLTCQGDRNWNADRVYVPLVEELERWKRERVS